MPLPIEQAIALHLTIALPKVKEPVAAPEPKKKVANPAIGRMIADRLKKDRSGVLFVRPTSEPSVG